MGLGSESIITEVNDLLRGALVIPSIQRGYVWQKAQVPYLLDSLYRGYPIGSLLIWKTSLDVPLRMASVLQDVQHQLHPAVLLDGQQRLTSLAKVVAPDKVVGVALDVRFDLDEQTFLNPSGLQRRNPRLLHVSELLGDAPQFGQILARAGVTPTDSQYDEMYGRVRKVHEIRNTEIAVITVDSNDYEEVAEIFARVNQGGRRLSKGDLVYSAIAARWADGLDTIEAFGAELERQNFALDREAVLRLTGLLAGTSANVIKLIGKEISGDDLKRAWADTERALRYVVDFLKSECSIPRSAVLTSPNVVVTPAYYLFRHNGELTSNQSDDLRRWVYTAMGFSHYSNSVEPKLDFEARAIRDGGPNLFSELIRRASGPRSVGAPIEPQDLASKGASSAYFNLLYISALRSRAKDWLLNQALSDAPMTATSKIEYHHIFPKARVQAEYGRDLTNGIANLAFISGTANRRIAAKRPEEYLPEIQTERLSEQWVPIDPEVWSLNSFPDFLAQRRELLAEVLNDMLGLRQYQPGSDHLDGAELPHDDEDFDSESLSEGATNHSRLNTSSIAEETNRTGIHVRMGPRTGSSHSRVSRAAVKDDGSRWSLADHVRLALEGAFDESPDGLTDSAIRRSVTDAYPDPLVRPGGGIPGISPRAARDAGITRISLDGVNGWRLSD